MALVISAIGVNVHYLRFHPPLFGVSENAVYDLHARRKRAYVRVVSCPRSGLIAETFDDLALPMLGEVAT